MAPWKRTFYAAFVAQVCSITGFFFALPLLPLYLKELDPSLTRAELSSWSGNALGIAGLVMAVFGPIWGMLADRYGRKPMILRSMFGGVVILTLMGFAQSTTQIFILRMMQGAVTGTVTASVALVSSVAPRERSGYTLGMMQAAVFVGACVGPFIGGEVAELLSIRVAFWCGAGIVFLGGLLVVLFASEEFERPAPEPKRRTPSLIALLGASGFIAALVMLFMVRFANTVFRPTFPLFLKELIGTEEGVKALTGRMNGVTALTAAFAAAVLGSLGDRRGHKRLLVVSVAFAAVVVLGFALAKNVAQLYVLRGLFGIAAAGIMPSANALVRRVIEQKHLGKAYGLMASVGGLGWGLGAMSGGRLAAWLDNFRAPFVFTSAILAVSVVFVVFAVREPREDAAPDVAEVDAGGPALEPEATPSAD
jgi:DHA1 family multidrug resistance protein-like MFS transporter